MITLICIDNKSIENLLTIGNEYYSDKMESFDGVTPEFYYITCDNGEYNGIKSDVFTVKNVIETGKAAEQEISRIKALLGNPHDVIKAVQKLVEENELFKVTSMKLTIERTDMNVTTTIESNV